jgi:hypothetical protein
VGSDAIVNIKINHYQNNVLQLCVISLILLYQYDIKYFDRIRRTLSSLWKLAPRGYFSSVQNSLSSYITLDILYHIVSYSHIWLLVLAILIRV